MPKENFIAGLDIGSDKVTCVIGVEDPSNGKIKIVSGASKYCLKGIKGGVVVDISQVSNTISSVIEEAEEEIKGESINEVYLGVRGTHITSLNNRGVYNITRTDKEINSEDVFSVIENAKAIHIPPDREIIHVIPQNFSLDKEHGFPNPVGMEGSILEVNVHIITASSSHLNNISKAVANAGFNYVEHLYHLYPLCEIILSEEEKNIGSILINIGDQTTSIAIYYEGKICFSKELAFGSYHITKDISSALHTPLDVAKELKEKYGSAISSLIENNDPVTIVGLDRVTKKQVRPTELLEYIQPRVQEILEKIREIVVKSGYSDYAKGAVLSGGGSLLKGMPQAVKKILEVKDVHYGFPNPEYVVFDGEEYKNQEYFSAIGLICYPYIIKPNMSEYMDSKRNITSVKQILSWFKELFR